MKNRNCIAIQHTEGSYSTRWIDYCKQNNYNYKLVDCYSSDIIKQLDGCSHFLWHFHHGKLRDMLFARQLLYSIENMGIKVFPNFNTVWHFNDKIGQRYLFESIGAPLVRTQIFFDKDSALKWADETKYPVVFKLRGGAGSENVWLIKSRLQALNIIKKAFSNGFYSRPPTYRMKQNWIKFKRDRTFNYFRETIAGLKNCILPTNNEKLNNAIEKGYLYVQEFLPNNDHDIRIFTIGDRAVGIKRLVRENDFRASGSGVLLFNKAEINEHCVKIALDISKKLNLQSAGYDFIFDQNNDPKIVEISYAYTIEIVDPYEGYWDSSLKWHPGNFIPEYWMLDDLLALKD